MRAPAQNKSVSVKKMASHALPLPVAALNLVFAVVLTLTYAQSAGLLS